MIQPILINYHITGSNDYCNYCDEHAYAITKVEEDRI